MKARIPHFCLGVLVLMVWGTMEARELTFEQRVEAQRAIERVYYSHQVAASRPFEEAVPRKLLESEVRTYLKQSVALEQFWGRPVTTEALDRELQRIARGTLLPRRLEEIYAALDHDPFLVRECFVRPVLVDRLARNFYAYDERIHAAARGEVHRIRDRLIRGELDLASDHPRRQTIRAARIEKATAEAGSAAEDSVSSGRLDLGAEEFERFRARLSSAPGQVSRVSESRHAFVVSALIEETVEEIQAASYTVRKTSWDDWWNGAEHDFDESRARVLADGTGTLPEPGTAPRPVADVRGASFSARSGEGACLAEGWDNGSLDDFPSARSRHTVVWTGNEMIVWGGDRTRNGASPGSVTLRSGGRYDPLTDSWTPMSTSGAPQTYDHTAVWTGNEMIIWGGGSVGLNSGGRYDPLADSWVATSQSGAPSSRTRHTAVWTGSEMVVWGGKGSFSNFNTGGRYDPVDDTWTATSTSAAPSARDDHTAVWTGDEMIVWGGGFNTGGRYDPSSNSWAATTTSGAPTARSGHSAVWSGSEMIIWGGGSLSGGRYDPSSNGWTATPVAAATPTSRSEHVAVWSGSEMIVWGGASPTDEPLRNGARFDPVTQAWTPMTNGGSPSGRIRAAAVWSGSEMIVWGGDLGSDFDGCCVGYLNSGGRYDPSLNNWIPTSLGELPEGEQWHSTVWTGNEMIVWGGLAQYNVYVNTGARYNLVTDSWTPMTQDSAPGSRGIHEAVWAGDQMILWGGWNGVLPLSTGSRYDPVADSWNGMTLDNRPAGRVSGATVWSGSEMIVWGGFSAQTFERFQSGGRYDPTNDTWTSTSLVDAPSGRSNGTGVWTGSEMIVWGGWDGSMSFDTGGRYDPVTDSWTATSTTAVPTARNVHTAVWTGSEMIVWGGIFGSNTGGRYSPTSDSWQPTSTIGAPTAPRQDHTAVWTGREMIVWGGRNFSTDYDTGARYDPLTDSWSPTSMIDVPTPRRLHGAVWTGTEMLVWGGLFSNGTGGRYLPGNPDDDVDGFCLDEDCNDADNQIWSTPGEVLDLFFPTDKQTMTWSTTAAPGATSVRYDTLRTSNPTDFDVSGTCVETDGANTETTDSDTPGTGSLFAYLVRAVNDCPLGDGTVGNASAGAARAGRNCP